MKTVISHALVCMCVVFSSICDAADCGSLSGVATCTAIKDVTQCSSAFVNNHGTGYKCGWNQGNCLSKEICTTEAKSPPPAPPAPPGGGPTHHHAGEGSAALTLAGQGKCDGLWEYKKVNNARDIFPGDGSDFEGDTFMSWVATAWKICEEEEPEKGEVAGSKIYVSVWREKKYRCYKDEENNGCNPNDGVNVRSYTR